MVQLFLKDLNDLIRGSNLLKKLLIIGCGSIGQRHARNAKKLGVENILLFDIDLKRVEQFANEINTDRFYNSFEDIFSENSDIDAAMICTPSSLHLENSTYLANKGINLFIEKPLATDLKGVEELVETVKTKKLTAMIGQSYRFHEGFLKLKEILNDNVIGKIFHVNYYGGQYLPDWHPTRDYRTEYSAKKNLGGGVLLTTMSHTIDIVQWLFGDITTINGWKDTLSDLEIDVEDSVFLLLKTNRNIIINTSFDFLQQCPQHSMIITGEKGHIKADFNKHYIEICKKNDNLIIEYEFDDNYRYLKELMYFFKMVETNSQNHDLGITTGKNVLEILLDPTIINICNK
jgi:predicted dehydrogenase